MERCPTSSHTEVIHFQKLSGFFWPTLYIEILPNFTSITESSLLCIAPRKKQALRHFYLHVEDLYSASQFVNRHIIMAQNNTVSQNSQYNIMSSENVSDADDSVTVTYITQFHQFAFSVAVVFCSAPNTQSLQAHNEHSNMTDCAA